MLEVVGTDGLGEHETLERWTCYGQWKLLISILWHDFFYLFKFIFIYVKTSLNGIGGKRGCNWACIPKI